jgi:hypothetical protein
MKDKAPNPAIFIEVPKPINNMSTSEKELFVDQISQALSQSIINTGRE